MARIALLRAAALRPIDRFLRRVGAPTERILERVHLSPDLLHDPEGLLPAYLGTAFLSEAARLEGIPSLGALVAESSQVAELGTYGRKLARAASLPALAATLRRFHAGHHSGETYWLERAEPRPVLCQRFTAPLDDWGLQSSQYSILLAVGLLTAMARGPWRPRVHLRKGMAPEVLATSWSERVDMVPDQPRCAIEIDPLALPVVAPPDDAELPETRELADWYHARPADELAPSLRQWLTRVLRSDAVRIEVIAETIGTTPRTLQRRLGHAGTSYARVLGEARFEVAARLLARDDIEIREVAHVVGYRDAAHLTRAFHRWSGTTPSAFRRGLRAVLGANVAAPAPSAGASWHAAI